jgi:phage protein D
MSVKVPAFRITIEDQDISTIVSDRLISITLTECRGDEADQLDITLDDSDGQLALPRKGVRIGYMLGWRDVPLIDKGIFTVSGVEHSGTPDTITLRARSANLIDSFKQQRDRSFHDTTLGAVIEQIAAQNHLSTGISAPLRNLKIAHLDQTHESDAALLRRLGKKYDAVATVKNDKLLFIPINESRSASGKPLPAIAITRDLGDQHRYHQADDDAYSGVRAFWYDDNHGLRRSVVAGQAGNSKRLRTTYSTEADARTAASSEWQRIQRGVATFELALALGDPAISPQSPVRVSGYKPQIDQTEWLAAKAIHSISSSGLTTRVEFETKMEAAEAERELQKDPDEGITGVIANWKDKVSKKTGQQVAGEMSNPKTLKNVYSGKQTAKRAAALAWEKIKEVREILRENSD